MHHHAIALVVTGYALIMIGIDAWCDYRAYRLRDQHFGFSLDGLGILPTLYLPHAAKALVALFLFSFFDLGGFTSTIAILFVAAIMSIALALFTVSAVRSVQQFLLWRNRCAVPEGPTPL